MQTLEKVAFRWVSLLHSKFNFKWIKTGTPAEIRDPARRTAISAAFHQLGLYRDRHKKAYDSADEDCQNTTLKNFEKHEEKDDLFWCDKKRRVIVWLWLFFFHTKCITLRRWLGKVDRSKGKDNYRRVQVRTCSRVLCWHWTHAYSWDNAGVLSGQI